MICPVCKADMVVLEYHDVELDYCMECRGVWFDSGELKLVFRMNNSDNIDAFLNQMLHKPDAETPEKKRKCPICGRKMDKKDTGEKPKILIDVCGKGHGLWFDGGEVVQLAENMRKDKTSGTESENVAVEFIKQFFGTPE
jgi:hypothetical protein